MSYDTMDHAGWVERNIACAKQGLSTADKRRAAQGKGWGAAPDLLNPFQRRAMTLLGIMGSGIHNAPINWETVEWRPSSIWLTWPHELSTFDGRALTDGVLLAHDSGMRMAIQPAGRCFRIGLTNYADPDGWNYRRALLSGVIEAHRKRFPAAHHIHRTDITDDGVVSGWQERAEAAEARSRELEEALQFYGDPSKYPYPFTGGMGALWSDCGARARALLNREEG